MNRPTNGTKGVTKKINSKKSTPGGFTPAQVADMVFLMVCCIINRTGMYMGSLTTTGGLKFKFYDGDDVYEQYISTTDNTYIEVDCTINEVFGTEVAAKATDVIAAWGLRRASKGADLAK